MQDLTFTEKNTRETLRLSDNNFNFPLKKPMCCPYCNAFEDGTNIDRKLLTLGNGKYHGVVLYRCTYCRQSYTVIYDIDTLKKKGNFGTFFPIASVTYENKLLANLSQKFIDMYNQALRAELKGDIELAAIGFRQALECLVKDYAINELEKPSEEVSRKKLFAAISEYLGEQDLIKTADVVRILGNDYAHYERKYPEHDFQLLKNYMEIFIRLVETKVMIAHPPVSR